MVAIDISDLCAVGLVLAGQRRVVNSGAATVDTYKYGQRSGRHMHVYGENVTDPDNRKLDPTRKARELDPKRETREHDCERMARGA